MRRAPLRIAVLECDEPIGTTKEKYGGYGNLFKELLESGAERLEDKEGTHIELEVTKFDVVNQEHYPNLEDVDGILLTGSKFNAFDNDVWILRLVKFVKNVLLQNRVRLVGVCFGHQIIGRALDVLVDRSDKGWEISVVPVRLTPKGQELFGLDELNIYQMHRDIVYAYPAHAEQLGSTDLCTVQGMYVKNQLITVQGHPEFKPEIVAQILELRHAQGIFTDDMYEEALSRVSNRHDGVAVAAGFLKFLIEP